MRDDETDKNIIRLCGASHKIIIHRRTKISDVLEDIRDF